MQTHLQRVDGLHVPPLCEGLGICGDVRFGSLFCYRSAVERMEAL